MFREARSFAWIPLHAPSGYRLRKHGTRPFRTTSMTHRTEPMLAGGRDSGQWVVISPATPDDEETLWLMLTFAASMGHGGPDQVPAARADAYLSTYVSDWGKRAGDVGVIARDSHGCAIGAAWLRLCHSEHRFRVADPSVPELATAVLPQARGRAVGTGMMQSLIDLAAPAHQRITLSVRAGNPARRFYARLGFIEVSRMQNRVGGESIVMILDLRQSTRPLAP
jgi:GNAT superfamily N-acetyltransferase